MARALTMATTFIGDHKVALALGDNVLHGPGVGRALAAHTDVDGALVFGQRVGNPGDYGVVEFDRDGDVLSIEEKPRRPRSEFAVPGLYFYDNTVVGIAARVASAPGRRDLTAIHEIFRRQGRLRVSLLGPETAWLDAGDLDSMAAAAEFVRTVEITQGFKIGCVEEVAWRQGWIDDDALLALSGAAGRTGYGNYLGMLAGRRRDRTMIELPAQPPVTRLRRPRAHQSSH
jgi:glucose-1-phosphate thymidylyltransferase